MRDLSWCWAPLFALSIVLTGCSDDPECTTDGGCDEPDSAMPDAGMDSVSGDSGSPDVNVPDSGMPDIGLPDVDTTPTGPDDYTLCDNTLDCPAGGGRCILNLPLHHPDAAMNALVPVSDVFPDIPAGRGICGESCEASPGACGSSAFLADAPSYTCQVVYAAPTPYALGGVDDEAMRAGDSFAALCRPSFSDAANRLPETCGECASDAECGAGRCWDLAAEAPFDGEEEEAAGRCVEDCSAEAPCAQGFSCETTSAGDLCLPLLDTCESCVDADGDGFGLGFCDPTTGTPTPVDCDDAEALVYYEAEPVCGAVDHNCNGFADDVDMVGTDAYGSLHCSACGDGCSDEALGDLVGSVWACAGDEGARTCDAACEAGRFDCNMDGACEVDATSAGFQWALDADDDGAPCNPDPGSVTCVVVTACTAPADMVPAREYSADPFSCSDVSCPDADDDNEFIFPGGEEFCDTLDNNQTGATDEIFTAGTAVCQLDDRAASCGPGTVNIGASCSTSCSAGGLPLAGSWQCTESGVACAAAVMAADIACNDLDDNCDGRVDEPLNDACVISGLDSPCKRDATQQCSGGALSCTAAAASAYSSVHDAPGDDYDADCDGVDGEADAIYVYSGSVVPGEDGTRARPYRGLRAALDRANAPGGSDTIYVQSAPGTPVLLEGGPIDLRAGLRIYGGFSGGATSWNYTTAASEVCIPPTAAPVEHAESIYQPGYAYFDISIGMLVHVDPYTTLQTKRAYIGLRCQGLTGTATPAVVSRINLEVTACGAGSPAAPAGVGHSVYGGVFIDCENIILQDLTVTNGAAGSGQPGFLRSQPSSLGPYAGGRGGTAADPVGDIGEGPNGGARGITLGADGEWPTAGGDRGTPASAQLPFPALPTQPSDGGESFYLTSGGFLEHLFTAPYRSARGGSGDYGSGGGGGFVGISTTIYNGGRGGTGGQRGSGGIGGYAGGDNVALVLLGTQLPTLTCSASSSPPVGNTPDFTPCGRNVSFDGGISGAGGQGGVGGQGGNGGGGGDGAPNGSDIGGDGGGGGPGCGGGGGGGGAAGAAAGLLHDISSSDAADDALWLNFTPGSSGARGNAAQQGPDGVAGDGNSRDAPPGRAACSGAAMSAQGRAGMTTMRTNLPMLSCGALSAVDTQDIDQDQWIVEPEISGGVVVIPRVSAVTCAPQ